MKHDQTRNFFFKIEGNTLQTTRRKNVVRYTCQNMVECPIIQSPFVSFELKKLEGKRWCIQKWLDLFHTCPLNILCTNNKINHSIFRMFKNRPSPQITINNATCRNNLQQLKDSPFKKKVSSPWKKSSHVHNCYYSLTIVFGTVLYNNCLK